MSSCEKLEVNNEPANDIISIESEIYITKSEIRKAIDDIREDLRKLNGFNKIDNLSTKYFVLSFVKDIEAIKNHSEIIFSFKDKLSELYDKIGDNEEKNSNGIYRPEKAENSKNEDISFEEVKEKLKETMRNVTIIINDFEKGVIYIAKENNNKNYIKDIIEQLEPLEKSIEELDRYKEVISEFCK